MTIPRPRTGGLIPILEFCEFFRVSRATAAKACARVGIGPIRVGRRLFMPITADFRERLEARKQDERMRRGEELRLQARGRAEASVANFVEKDAAARNDATSDDGAAGGEL